MVKVIDQRPTHPQDSLRRLLAPIKTPASVPHGVKVAQPGEYVTFFDSAGDGHRWDGDVIAAYDARMAQAEEQMAEAKAGLSEAEAGLVEASGRITAAEAELTGDAVGKKASAYINEHGTLVGRDAILTGTLDVAQLNVTEQMAAEIVNAMSLNTKKLVVSEEAILNQLTVIQSIVTPELIAQKIDVQSLGAQLVTSGAIQTDTGANRGVKISSAGINAWDASGRQTIRLDGTDNLLTGDFSTADNYSGKIRMFTTTHTVTQNKTGYITMHGAGGTAGSQGVIEYTDGQLALSVKPGRETGHADFFSKGVVVTPDGLTLAGDLTLSGLFRQTNSFRAHSAGPYTISGNGFLDVNFTFPNAGNRPYILPSVSFDDAADINLSLWNVTTTSARVRVYNSGANTVRGLYVDIVILPLRR